MSQDLIAIARELSLGVSRLSFGSPVSHVYNPLEYAWEAHATYLERFGQGSREIVLLGMNPGPWGMAQTGVPFGEVEMVRDWLGISSDIARPAHEHPKRPVMGFGCRRREVSGRRLWGWARRQFGTPERFFERFLIANYCPLLFLEASGRNRTPDRLPTADRAPLLSVCDAALRRSVLQIQPEWVIGVGKFAQSRAEVALEGTAVRVGSVLHPSPASPAANRDWQGQAMGQLAALGIEV